MIKQVMQDLVKNLALKQTLNRFFVTSKIIFLEAIYRSMLI